MKTNAARKKFYNPRLSVLLCHLSQCAALPLFKCWLFKVFRLHLNCYVTWYSEQTFYP